jgi:uncharacterized protein (TIGR03435 family)
VRLVYSRVPLQKILMDAFEVPIDQLSGPDWIVTTRFDITANVPVGATKEQADVMLQNLLVERLHLAFHRQPKDFTGYELLVAPSGLKLRPTTVDPASLGPPPSERQLIVPAKDGYPELPPSVRQSSLMRQGATFARFRSYSLAEFARWLGPRMGTIILGPIGPDSGYIAAARIVDKTGLTGYYDFTLEYAGAMFAAEALPLAAQERLDASGPSIFTALEKQLGLKLQKTKVAADVIVIDHADKTPIEN